MTVRGSTRLGLFLSKRGKQLWYGLTLFTSQSERPVLLTFTQPDFIEFRSRSFSLPLNVLLILLAIVHSAQGLHLR